MREILVLNGPNLNLLGAREPGVYGTLGLADIESRLRALAPELGVALRFFQSNHEGALIDELHAGMGRSAGAIFNPGAYTHTSIALRDAIAAVRYPVVEVHLSNVQAREEFRKVSMVAAACAGTVAGFGWRSYELALRAVAGAIADRAEAPARDDGRLA
ncbi:MAG: type II 3-dehydroquinate dehydratase [Spirochaetes bacterium]|nr:type II 3-dehydroquinate dehydratase [Spirochaetota bacterium]